MRSGRASLTAMMVAYWRALGDLGVTTVPGFSDAAAAKLLRGPFWHFMLRRARALAQNPKSELALGMRPYLDGLILRVAFIDAVLQARAAGQVVILGAGLDTRAWRLSSLRGARVFEVDHPSTQAYKRARLGALGAPLAQVDFVPLDFTRDDLASALRAAGHDPSAPSVWIWEGVIMYLNDAALRSTLDAVRRLSAPGSTLIAHYHEPETTAAAASVRRLLLAGIGEPHIGLRTRQTMQAELERAGFHVLEDAGLAEQAARVGAVPPSKTTLQVSRISVAE